jgi:hypothetical protein
LTFDSRQASTARGLVIEEEGRRKKEERRRKKEEEETRSNTKEKRKRSNLLHPSEKTTPTISSIHDT